jgi:gliding motility-associated-like protein
MKKRTILTHILLLAAMLLPAVGLHSQTTVILVQNDTIYIDACTSPTGTIYDDGGASGNYSNNFRGYVVIEAMPGQTISLQGDYTLESPSYDWIDVWDGPFGQGTLVVDRMGNNGTLDVVTTSGILSLYFRTDGSVTYSGFALNWNVTGSGAACSTTASDLVVSNIGTGTATLGWSGTASEYNIRLDGYPVGSTAGTTYTLGGLVANMEHTVTVAPAEADATRCCATAATFRTLCGTVGIPYVDGFEADQVEMMPACWTKVTNFDEPSTQPQVIEAPGTHHALKLSCGPNATGGHFGLVVGPAVGGGESMWHVSFSLRPTHYGSHVVVGVCDSTSSMYDLYGFVPLDTLTLNDYNSWNTYTYDWTLPEGGCRLAFYMLRSMEDGDMHFTYIDNVKIERCGVYSIGNYHTDCTSTILQWQTFGEGTVTLGIRRSDLINDVTTVTGATSPYLLTGLEPGTAYTVDFYSDCGGVDGLLQTLRFSTEDCYTTQNCLALAEADINTFTFINTDDRNIDEYHHLHANRTHGDYAYIISPLIDTLAGREIYIQVNGYYCDVSVGTVQYADDPSTFIPLATVATDYFEERYAKVTVPANSTAHYAAVRFTPYYITLNDFRVGDCLVDSLRIQGMRGTSASLRWASGYDTVIVEYGPEGFTPGTGSEAVFIDTSAGRIGGLQTYTYYDFYAHRPCDTTSCVHQKLTAITSQYDYSMPYCEDFESIDLGWATWNPQYYYYSSPDLVYEPVYLDLTRTLRFASYGFPWDYYTEVRLPDVELESPAVLAFDATDYSPEGYYAIGFTGTGWFDTVNLVPDGSRHHYTVQIPDEYIYEGNALMMRYWHTSQYQYYTSFIDEVSVASVAYDSLQFTYVGFDSAIATLTTIGSPADTTVMLHPCYGHDTVYGQYIADSNYWLFTGLDSGTYYYCYVMLGEESCLSLAAMITTRWIGGGEPECYTFDGLLSYEIPETWSATYGVDIDEDHLRLMTGSAVATRVIDYPADDFYFSFHASGTFEGQKLLICTILAEKLTEEEFTLTDVEDYFLSFDTVNIGTEWQPYFVDLPWQSGSSLRICIVALGGVTMVDNVSVTPCAPLSFEVVNNTIVVTVPDGQPPSHYVYISDDASTDSRTVYIGESPQVIEDLRIDRDYSVSWNCSSGCSFYTTLHTGGEIALPYCEEFHVNYDGSSGIPLDWHFHYTDPTYFPYLEPNDGFLMIGAEWVNQYQYVVLPPVATTGLVHLVLRFYAYGPASSFEVGLMPNGTDTASFVPLRSLYDLYDYNTVDLVVPAIGNNRLAIRTSGYRFGITRISISQTPNITVSLIDSRTLSIAADVDTSYYLQYNTWSGTPNIVHVDTNPYLLQVGENIDDLTMSVVFDEYGTACGDNTVAYQLSDRMGLPYCIGLDYGWGDWYLRNHWRYTPCGYSYQDGYEVYRFNTYYNPEVLQYLLLPDMAIDSVRRLSLYFKMKSTTSNDFIEIGVMTDAYDTNTFTVVDTIYSTAPNTWGTHTASLADYSGDGRWIAFRHRGAEPPSNSDEDYLFIDDMIVDVCPANLATATLYEWNTVIIDNVDTATGYFAEYGPIGFSQGNGAIVRIDSVPMLLTLSPSSEYEFYFHCDSTGTSCLQPQYIHTYSSPFEVPACIDFDDMPANVLPSGWSSIGVASSVSDTYSHSDNHSLQVNGLVITPYIQTDSLQEVAAGIWLYSTDANDRIEVGCMSNPYDISSFTALRTITPRLGVWDHYDISFADAPSAAHFIAFRRLSHTGSSSPTIYLDDLNLSTCATFGLKMANVEDDNVTLEWSQVGHPAINVTVMLNGTTPVATLHPTAPPLNISPLVPGAGYSFIFSSTCSSGTTPCSLPYSDTVTVVAPAEAGNCINPTNLASENAVFYSGSYSNPYSAAGAIDYGSLSIDSRHTVCYDTSARDPRTGGLLRMVPEGAIASVRLGNWGSNINNPEAEGVTYSLFVDTLSFNLLIMSYAAVLQDPMHAAEDQPRFRLELLDSAFNLIDPQCAAADFIANRNLGWNEADNNVLWKDWTTFGVDLTDYANQSVYVRLTTYDCNEGSHYGYAYFTLDCMRRSIITNNCGAVDSNTLTAPAGFFYNWYSSLSPTVFSHDQSVTIPVGEVTYYCDVVSQENSSCMFTLSAYAGTRYPLSSFDTTVIVRNCGFDVLFNNTSAVSADGVNPLASGEACETAYWDFGNGETSTNYHGSAHYDTPGTYTVTLVSGIAGDACTDTATMVLNLAFPAYNPHIEGPTETCADEEIVLSIVDAATLDPNWPLNQLTFKPTSTTNISVFTIDPNGCSHTLHHSVLVHPAYHFIDTLWLCSTQLPFAYADTVYQPGTTEAVYNRQWQSIYGCDSIYSLQLTVSSSAENIAYDTTLASICDNHTFHFFGTDYTDAGTYDQHHLDIDGLCDSLHTLILEVRPTSATDTVAIACDTLMWHDTTLTVTTVPPLPYVTLENTSRCDSTVTLHLTVNYSTASTVNHTIVENQLPYTYSPAPGISATFLTDTTGCIITIPNSVDCDSTITFNLTVYRNQDTVVDSTICEGLLPFEWNGVTFNGPGTDSALLYAATGADSTVHMTLHVLLNSTFSIADTLLQNALGAYIPPLPVSPVYDSATLLTYAAPLVTIMDSLVILPNAVGCDSLVHYTLNVYHNYHRRDTLQPCRHEMPAVYLGDTLATDSAYLYREWMLTSVHGADSLVSVDLFVRDDYELADTLVFCPSQQYIYEGINYGGPAEFDAPHLSVYGCDSLVHVVLMPRDTSFRLDIFYSLSGTDWVTPDSIIGICAPDTLYLLDTTPTATSRQWYLATPDTLVTSADSLFSWPFYVGSDTINALAGVIVNSGDECFDTLVWPVAVLLRPEADFIWSPDIPANHNPEVQFYNLSSPYDTVGNPSTTSFLWQIQQTEGGPYDTTSAHSPFYHWGEPGSNMMGEYDVILTAYWAHTATLYNLPTDGWPLQTAAVPLLPTLYPAFSLTCSDTTHHTVVITNDYLQFPNLVTPNGDGINDIWEVVGLLEYGNYSMNELWIYDRTGALVYHVRNIRRQDQFWNPLDTHSPDGTYYYRFSAEGEYGIVRRNGLIEVIR